MTLFRFALLALVAAAAATAGATAPARAEAPAWTVDRAKSKLTFTFKQSGTASTGAFKAWTADIRFSPDDLAASKVTVTVDMKSALVGNQSIDESLPTETWFHIAKFPKATFATKSFKKTASGYEAAATLTLRGVTKDVLLVFTLDIKGDRATMKGTARLMRTQFGVGQGDFAKTNTVADDVVVGVEIVATRKK